MKIIFCLETVVDTWIEGHFEINLWGS